MPKPESVQEYLDAVTEQIRWKRARSAIAWELRQHLEEQRDAFAAEGHTPEEAERLAVQEMGDPVPVGTELDRIHRPKPQWGLLALTVLLALTGGFLRVRLTGDGAAAAAVGLGTAALLAGYLLDCSWLFSHPRPIYFASLAIGVLTLYLSPHINNASYYAHYIVQFYPVIYALWLYSFRGRDWTGFFWAAAGGAPLAAICFMIPDLSSAIILFASGALLLLLAVRMDWFQISKPLAATLLTGLTLSIGGVMCYGLGRSGRIITALHPESDPIGRGYHGTAIRNALSAAQWLGAGEELPVLTGTNLSFEQYLPEWKNDCLLTTLIYKLGWLPFLLLITATAVLVVWMLWKCLRQSSQTGRMLVLATTAVLGLQMLCSVAMNLGFVLFSAQFPLLVGNFRTITDMFLIGLALSAFRCDTAVPLRSRRIHAG